MLQAIKCHNRADCIQLLAMGATLHARLADNATLLHHAAVYGNSSFCEFLLITKQYNVNEQNSNNETPLSLAAQEGWPDVCRALIAHGANVHQRDEKDRSLLLKSIQNLTNEKYPRRKSIITNCKLLQQHGLNSNEFDAKKSLVKHPSTDSAHVANLKRITEYIVHPPKSKDTDPNNEWLALQVM